MLKKRLVGVVTVRQGWAVQSFGYRRYLPMGRPEVIIENLDRWGADEILIHCIDRSPRQVGPDFALLKRVGSLGLSTPLIYGGGIRDAEDAVKVVSFCADRISVDSMLWSTPHELERISLELGTQAIMANMPVRVSNSGLVWRNYLTNQEVPLTKDLFGRLPLQWVSEVILTDWSHEGFACSFDLHIPALFPSMDKPLVVFGGLSEPSQYRAMLSHDNIVGVAVGNFLSHKEHAIQLIKQHLHGIPIRPAQYDCEEFVS